MNRLSTEKRVAVLAALVEGNSLRATSRMTDVARMTVERLLRDVGAACAAYHDAHVRGLKSRRIQCDEIWSFIGAKAGNVAESKRGRWGDCWTWTALDADTKLIVSYMVGPRTPPMAYKFVKDVAARVAGPLRLTTDGLYWYIDAVDHAFGIDVDYGMLEKHYGRIPGDGAASVRHSPTRMTAAERRVIKGHPDPRHTSPSYLERQDLNMRMHIRRFTRLTNGFSKKIEMHAHAVALHSMYYSFCKTHPLRVTPAMEAGLTTHAWEIPELLNLLEVSERPEALPA